VAFPIGLLAGLAWYWPSHVKRAVEWQLLFTSALGAIFPPILAYASRSQFPATTAIYMTIAFLLLSLHFFYTYKELMSKNEELWFERLWNIRSSKDMVGKLILVFVVAGLVVFSIFLIPGTTSIFFL
jgi:hypothetical protein